MKLFDQIYRTITAGSLGLLFIVAGATRVRAQVVPQPVSGLRPIPAGANFSGFWELRYDSLNVPYAELIEAAKAKLPERHSEALKAMRWCNRAGMPALMLGPGPLDFALGDQELAISSEIPSTPRHISLVRIEHVNPDVLDPETNGDSIARWQGASLIVDTVGFSDKGFTEIPGGGFRTQTSHLTERFRLIEDGARLEVTSTWVDPAVFAKPHSYRILYSRAAAGYNAREPFCDASDKSRDVSILAAPEPVLWK